MSRHVAVDYSVQVPEGIDEPDLYRLALAVLKRTKEDSPMPVSELLSKIGAHPENGTQTSQIYSRLLEFTRVDGSRIASRKGRSGGYFIRPVDSIQNDLPTSAEQRKEKTFEKHLWPVVARWLKQVKQVQRVSCDIANLKSGGIWSNPDVVGINIVEELGFYDVEVTTVEVKPSLQNWRYYFFEAVSHKRFSERVYFVYRDDNSAGTEQRLEILRYSEKYGVGVAEMQLSDEAYEKLPRWDKLSEEDRTTVIESIVEVMPAPFEAISMRNKVDFFRQLGVTTKPDLYNFGS